MTYNEKLKNNKIESVFDQTAQGTFKFSEDTPFIVGKFIRYDLYKRRPWDKGSTIYVLDTDKGEAMFFLSGATDKIIKNSLIPGQIYSFRYLGKKKTNRGREMNNFRIEHILDVPKEEPSKPVKRRTRRPRTVKEQVPTTEPTQQDNGGNEIVDIDTKLPTTEPTLRDNGGNEVGNISTKKD